MKNIDQNTIQLHQRDDGDKPHSKFSIDKNESAGVFESERMFLIVLLLQWEHIVPIPINANIGLMDMKSIV